MASVRWLSLLIVLVTLACGGEPAETKPPAPAWDRDLELAQAEDLNDDPDIVEVALDARPASLEIVPGTTSEVWTYNGTLPGPLIRAKVGDRLMVHFTNDLPEATTIHWHGVRLPVEMDGVPEVSQAAVEPGGSFHYSFVLPDAGLYWYHPHFDSAAQVGNGLYGAILVEDPAEKLPGDELVVILSDIALGDDGVLSPPDSSGELGTLFGREGNVLLVNGRVKPTLEVQSGKLERWRVLNAAKTRYFGLSLRGTEFWRIGGDGGLAEYPVSEKHPALAPAERLDLMLAPVGEADTTTDLAWTVVDRGYGSDPSINPDQPIMTLRFGAGGTPEAQALPDVSRSIDALDLGAATPVAIEFTQGLDEKGGLVLGVNGDPFGKDEPVSATVGETQVWTVSTQMAWSHPFHLHGFFFQVLDESGQPQHPLAWKDTVNVPHEGSTRLAVKYDDRPGMWMFHCHILDHAEQGMMGMLHLSQ